MYTLSKIDFDRAVVDHILEIYHNSPSRSHRSCNTWHSKRIRTNPYTWFNSTFTQVEQAIGNLKIGEWWFNVAKPGEEYRWHEHVPYTHTAVLYLQVPDNSGAIEFRKYEEYQQLNPSAGDFIEFSGNLAHRVLPNLSNDYRISVAFNLK